jgi:hypothetical protein
VLTGWRTWSEARQEHLLDCKGSGQEKWSSGLQPGGITDRIREGKSPDDKKNSAFSTIFFANFHYFCVLFPSSRWNSTKPQHFTMHHYSAKQHSGIIY